MKKRTFVILTMLLLLLAGCDGAPAPQTADSNQEIAIRLATNYRDDSIGYQQLEGFARLLQEKSGNTMLVQLYSAGAWSQPSSFVDYVKQGSLEMACLEPAEMRRLQPAYELYQQPYLFYDIQSVAQYVTGENGRKALGTLPPDYYGVGFVPDGYQYLLQQDGQTRWISYGELKRLGQTKALADVAVYDLRACYSLQPIVTMRSWWEALTEEQQTWIQESFQEALTASFAQQEDKDPAQVLLANGVTFEDNTTPAWNNYSNLCLNQREAYFATYSNSLTAYWRPIAVEPPTIEGEEPTP